MTDINHHIWLESAVGKELSEPEAIELHLLSRREEYRGGQHIFEEGAPAHEFFLIVEGEVEVVQRAENDRVVVLATLGPLSLLGEMSLLSQGNRSATARVKGHAKVLRVEWEACQELLKNNPTAAYKLIYAMARVLAGRLRSVNHKVAELTTSSEPTVEDRKLEEFATFKQKLLSDWSF